jgi:hypothetical protein
VSTFGQLRLTLQQSLPGLSLDLIDEFLNTRYSYILEHMRWQGLEQTAYIETVATYFSSTDTVSVTQGSTAVVGVGTSWTSALTGQKFRVVDDGPFYVFTYVSATSATLDRAYEDSTESGMGYQIFTNTYALPTYCKAVLSIESADDGFRLTELTEMEMGDSVGFRDSAGNPAVYAIDVTQASGTLETVELFPYPCQAKGYPIRYLAMAPGFTGSNTGNSPLPFVSDGSILAGVRADGWAELGNVEKVAFYESKFAKELAQMVKAEMLRKPKVRLKPDRSTTRHRIARLLRNTYPRIPN